MQAPIRLRAAGRAAPLARTLGAATLVLALAACQTTPPISAELEEVRTAVQLAATNPDVTRHAGLELQRAQQALAQAESQWRDRDAEGLKHWAYLARQRAATAQALARQARDEDRLRTAGSERERVRLEARTREAELARQRASSAEQQAQSAQQQAQTAQQQAQAAQASAASAQQQTQQMRDAAAQAAARAEALERDLQTLQARKTDRGMVITLGDVLFTTGRAELNPGAMRQVDRLAAVLQQYPERRVMVEGFTDNVGGTAMNQALSERRAQAFADALRNRGIDARRIQVQGHGEAYPVADNGTAAGRQMNRRVEVLFSDAQGGFIAR